MARLTRTAVTTRFLPWLKVAFPVSVFYFLWRGWLLLLADVAPQFLPAHVEYTPLLSFGIFLPRWIYIWGNFDGIVFMKIAAEGYGIEQVPFFPLLPILMAQIHEIFKTPVLVAGIAISLASFLLALQVVYLLFRKDGQKNFWLFLAVLLSFPTAFFFTAVYQDSLFFLLATATLLFGRKRWWFAAALMAALATLARLNGLALFFFLFVEYFLSFAEDGKSWSMKVWQKAVTVFRKQSRLIDLRDTLPFFLVPFAFLSFLGYIQWKFGDWHLFFEGVQVWHRDHLVLPPQTFWRYFKILVLNANITFTYWIALGEALATALYGGVLLWGWKRIRPSYWIFMFFHLLIPTLTGTLQGMPRYGLHLYPLFLVLLLWVEKMPRWAKVLYFAIMLGLQAAYLIAYVQGYFVA